MGRAGIAILLSSVVAGLAGGCAVVFVSPALPAMATWMLVLATAGLLALIFGACVAPIIFGTGRDVEKLRAQIEDVPDCEEVGTYHSGAWLRPISEAVTALQAGWTERLTTLNTRFRELEIRHRLIEAERDHAETILNSLHDAVIVTDSFNEISLTNQRAADLLGFETSTAERRSIDEIVRDDRIRELIKEIRSSGVVSRQKHVEHAMEVGAREGGSASTFDVTLAALPDGQNGVGGVVTILRDITKEREISQLKSDFVSQASHELRTPLSSINAYIEMLIDSEAEDEASRQEFYQVIKGEADRVSRMIDNMLNISRIEAGIVSVERTDCDFVKICRDVIDMIQPQGAAKEIMLSLKSGPLVYTAEADQDMMHQVVMNLVSNAIKYTPDGGRVTVSVENDDTSRSVMVSVADTGLGIPPDAIPRLFDKFFRIDNYKRVAKGTGLGLNLVKHIVETVHHGRITVTSELGMGSRFVVMVPYEDPTSR